MADQNTVVGIDVSKDRLDVHILETEEAFSVENSRKGWKRLRKRLLGLDEPAIGMEASGGYEKGVADDLALTGFAVYVLNAGQVRAFARGVACHAKTDPLDARIIARCLTASLETARPWAPDPDRSRLSALVSYRQALVAERTELKGRLDKTSQPTVQRLMRHQLGVVKQSLLVVEKEIAAALKETSELRDKAALIGSAPGAGPVLIATLLAQLPEIGRIDSRALCALVGVAPFDRQSGTSRWSGRCLGGRSYVRRVVYMATRSAVRGSNPALAEFYARKRAEGKPDKVAMVATMRKFLLMLNAMIRDEQPWKAA